MYSKNKITNCKCSQNGISSLLFENCLQTTDLSLFISSQTEQKVRHTWKGNKVLYYRFTPKVVESEVSQAFLHFHLIDQRTSSGNESIIGGGFPDDLLQITVHISRVIRNGNQRSASVQSLLEVALTRAELAMGKWVKANATAMLADWFQLPRENLAVILRAQDSDGKRIAVPDTKADSGTNSLPYLEVYLQETSRRRTKRTLGLDCKENSDETRCCRYPLTVDFEEFGWDWIIAPKRYDAFYCNGECPYALFQKYPHTHIVHLAAPPGSVGPCCAPRKMSSISMLYFDHELNIIFGTIPGMVVERCGCS